jgi:hypothetical protein
MQRSMTDVNASHFTQIEEVSNAIASIPFMRSRDCQCVELLKSLRALYAALVAAIAQIQQ